MEKELEKVEEQRKEEEAAKIKIQDAAKSAEMERQKKQVAEESRSNAARDQAVLKVESSLVDKQLKALNAEIDENMTRITTLEGAKSGIRSRYSFAFADTGGATVGRWVWGVFSAGTSELAMKVHRDRCYELMQRKDVEIAVYRR